MKVPHLWCDSHTSFKVKRSKVKVTWPINADTHRPPYLPNGKAYELQTWYTGGWRRPTSATGAMTSKVNGKGRKVTWSVWAVWAQRCTCVTSGRRGHTVLERTRRPHFLFDFVVGCCTACCRICVLRTCFGFIVLDLSSGSIFVMDLFYNKLYNISPTKSNKWSLDKIQ